MGPGTTLHWVPFQCHITACCTPPELPTAQTSLAVTAATPVSVNALPPGPGTMRQPRPQVGSGVAGGRVAVAAGESAERAGPVPASPAASSPARIASAQ